MLEFEGEKRRRAGGRAGGRRDGRRDGNGTEGERRGEKGRAGKGREGLGWGGCEVARREALVSHAFVRMVLPVCEAVRGHEQAGPRAWCVRTCVHSSGVGWRSESDGLGERCGRACLSLRYTSATLGSAT